METQQETSFLHFFFFFNILINFKICDEVEQASHVKKKNG